MASAGVGFRARLGLDPFEAGEGEDPDVVAEVVHLVLGRVATVVVDVETGEIFGFLDDGAALGRYWGSL